MPSSDPRKIILQIDGSLGHRAELERALGQVRPGTSVRSLDRGSEALEHLSRCGHDVPMPDLVLVSKALPDMDGCEVLRRVRALAHLATLPVILVHSDDETEDVRRALELGATAFLPKPVQKPDYAEFARAIVEESWRGSGGPVAGQELATVQRALQSAQKPTMSATVLHDAHAIPIPGDANAFRALYDHMRGIIQQTFDPVMVAIHDACRKHRIPPGHAMGRGQDQVTVANREEVIFDLFDLGYSDRVIRENFVISDRQIERLRAKWRVKRGGVLAVRKI